MININCGKFYTLLKVALLLVVCGPANSATNYFVDSNLGDDVNLGEAITTSCTNGPWKTLAKLKTKTLVPGDTVTLRCGSVWREPLTITGAGNSTAIIHIQAEASCADADRPQVNGALSLKGTWTRVGTTSVYWTTVAPVKQVFVDGLPLTIARYPATGYLLPQSGSTTSLTDTNVPAIAAAAGSDLSGAKVYVRTYGWIIEETTATTISGNILNFSALQYAVRLNAGYYLSNKLWMLNTAPGWYHDGAAGKLYVRLPDGSAPSTTSTGRQVEASTTDYGIQLSSQPYVKFSGIRVIQAGVDGVNIGNSPNTTLDNLSVKYSGRNGINFNGTSTGLIQNSKIFESFIDGIYLKNTSTISVYGNTVENSGVTNGPIRSFAAIQAHGSENVDIERNTVINSGYVGIRFNRNATVKNNVVTDSCMTLADCGAIYSWVDSNYAPEEGGDEFNNPMNSVVIGNIVENVIGNMVGNPDAFASAPGIYLDELSNGVQVTGNTVINAEKGINLHNAFNVTVDGNWVAYPRGQGIVVATDYNPAISYLTSIPITNNTILNSSVVPFFYYLDKTTAPGRDTLEVLTGNKYTATSATSGFVIDHRPPPSFTPAPIAYSPSTVRALTGKVNHGTYIQSTKISGLLTNKTAAPIGMACPFTLEADCTNSRLFGSTAVIIYPVTVPAFSSLAITR
jgi:parallel beta-helix repeat protein